MIVAVQSRASRGEEGEEDMFATIIGDRVHVRLSRRNLRQLDDLLAGAVRGWCLARRDENGVSLIVQVDDDADHYEGRDPSPALGSGEAARRT
jgi:hypothetical protein